MIKKLTSLCELFEKMIVKINQTYSPFSRYSSFPTVLVSLLLNNITPIVATIINRRVMIRLGCI